MNRSQQTADAPPAPAAETRISVLVGDRICIRCGYNLVGQTIVREPHYHMLIVRCPECATVASVQEYPLLGRWASRWAVLLAALWFLICTGMVFATTGILWGFSDEVAGEASITFAQRLAERQKTWMDEQNAAGKTNRNLAWMMNQPASAHSAADPDWIAQQDLAAILAELGGWRAMFNWRALLGWEPMAMVLLPLGFFWAVALCHLRRRRLLLFLLVPVGLALTFMVIGLLRSDTAAGAPWRYIGMRNVAQREMSVPVEIITMVFGAAVLLSGMMLGRPLLRLLIRALLPPRLRSSLAVLWIADGLPPPRAG